MGIIMSKSFYAICTTDSDEYNIHLVCKVSKHTEATIGKAETCLSLLYYQYCIKRNEWFIKYLVVIFSKISRGEREKRLE